MADRGLSTPAAFEASIRGWAESGRTAFLAGWDGRVRGALAVADTLRPESKAVVEDLADMRIDTAMITGDSRSTAEAVAAEAGINLVTAEVQPAGKAQEIARLQANGRVVGFVGDGINDAPALVQADLGFAVGTGSQSKRATSSSSRAGPGSCRPPSSWPAGPWA
jgi:P-type E1-E2 ATPase